MNPYTIIFYLFSNIIFLVAIERFMGVFFEKRKTSFRVMTLSYLLFFILASVERLLFNTSGSHLIFVLPILFIISLNYDSSMPKRFVAIVSNYVLFSMAASLAAYFLDSLPASINTYENDIFIGKYMVTSLISLILSSFLKRFKKIRKSKISTPLFWIFVIIIPGSTISIMVFYSLGLLIFAELTAVFFLIGANLLLFFVYDALSAAHENKLKLALQSQEKEYYLSQCRLMQESVEKMKSYRHDIKLHLAALKDYIANNEAATDYLNSLLGDVEESEVYSDTGNIAFDSIINFKLKNAIKDGIKLEINLFVPPVLNVEEVDIVTILGNLLDNALDAVAKVNERIIKLSIKSNKGNLFIKIDNTFDGTINYAEGTNEKEKRIATLKAGDRHGHGLKNIRKSVEKYNGHIDIAHDESIFSVGILLYVDEPTA